MRRIWAGLATGLIGVIGGSALGLQALAGVQPQTIAPLIPWSSDAQRQAARASILDGSRQASARFAKDAVAAMPIDQFALAGSSSGKPPEQQLAILNLASALGWRDPATNLALIDAALRETEPVIAAQRIDALGRTAGAEAVTPLADTLLQMEGGIEALAVRAQTRSGGSWWEGYFRSEPRDRAGAIKRTILLSQFDRGDGAWLNTVIRDAAIGFSKGGYDDLTLQAWRTALPQDAQFSGPVYDPKFAGDGPKAGAVGSEWLLAPSAPALISKAKDGGIIIEREQKAGGALFSQMLLIEPGRWRLGTDSSETGNPALEWRVSCSGSNLGLGSLLSGGSETAVFTVPANCKTVRLTLFAAPQTSATASSLELRSVAMVREE